MSTTNRILFGLFLALAFGMVGFAIGGRMLKGEKHYEDERRRELAARRRKRKKRDP